MTVCQVGFAELPYYSYADGAYTIDPVGWAHYWSHLEISYAGITAMSLLNGGVDPCPPTWDRILFMQPDDLDDYPARWELHPCTPCWPWLLGGDWVTLSPRVQLRAPVMGAMASGWGTARVLWGATSEQNDIRRRLLRRWHEKQAEA